MYGKRGTSKGFESSPFRHDGGIQRLDPDFKHPRVWHHRSLFRPSQIELSSVYQEDVGFGLGSCGRVGESDSAGPPQQRDQGGD